MVLAAVILLACLLVVVSVVAIAHVRALRQWSASGQTTLPPSLVDGPRYQILRGGVVYWSGDDGLEAKQAYEGTHHGQFYDNGILRGAK